MWRHTCFSFHRLTGRFLIVEDGVVRWDQATPEVQGWMKARLLEMAGNWNT